MDDTLTFAGDTLTQLTNGFGEFFDDSPMSMFIDWGTIIELLVILMIPVLIVLVVVLFQYLSRRAKYRLAEKAVEAGVAVDVTTLLNSRKHKSAKKSLMRRIVWGGLLTIAGLGIIIFEATLDSASDADDFIIGTVILALGVGLVLSFVFGRKILAHDIELENREAEIEFQRRHKTDADKATDPEPEACKPDGGEK